nr:hypothetical protein [Tanacetum cinerariifolium]
MSSAFADTHNVVAILAKSDASEGFDQIIDFLNGSSIQYALTVNPHMYVSYDAEGVDCLPNEEIFTVLARMGYEKPSTKLTFYKAFFSSQWKFLIHTILQSLSAKRTSWNEFSSTMASAIICLSTGRKFNFSKYIFDSLVRNVDSSSKFYMYPRFIQLIIQNQLGDLSPHTTKYISPFLTQKVFTNIRRIGKGFSSVETPLFEEDVPAVVEEDIQAQTISSSFPPPQDLPSMRKKEDIANDDQVEGRHAEIQAEKQAEIYQIDMDHAAKVLKVVTATSAPVSAARTIIPASEPNIPIVTITAAPVKVAAASTRQRRGVVIRDPEEESSAKTSDETKSKDKDKGILVEEPKPMKKKKQVEMDEAYVRKLHEELNEDIDWDVAIEHNTAGFKLDYFKGKSYDDIRLIFEAKFNTNMEFLLKSKEQIEEENRALESINETLAQKAAKRRRLNQEDKDVEEIKQHLEVFPDEYDDVYTEATPLARKVPVLDYQIILLNNKPRHKIIKADGTHQLYASFITVLKNFDRDDLETL